MVPSTPTPISTGEGLRRLSSRVAELRHAMRADTLTLMHHNPVGLLQLVAADGHPRLLTAFPFSAQATLPRALRAGSPAYLSRPLEDPLGSALAHLTGARTLYLAPLATADSELLGVVVLGWLAQTDGPADDVRLALSSLARAPR